MSRRPAPRAYRTRSAAWSYRWYRLLSQRHAGPCLRCQNGAHCVIYDYLNDNLDAAVWRLRNDERREMAGGGR